MPIYFGDKIKFARTAAGLTQKQLADKINVSNTSISNWEKNISRPDPDTIQHLCWALNVEPNYFFAKNEQKEDLYEIEDLVEVDGGNAETVPVSVSGMSGTGKSQMIANKFVFFMENKTVAKEPQNRLCIAGRDGTFIERVLTDEQLNAFKAMLDALPEAAEEL